METPHDERTMEWEAEQPPELYSMVLSSPESADEILSLLWKTRKSGLSGSVKSTIQSLLRLPCLSDVDPAVASIRVLIRKFLQKDSCSSVEEIIKMIPPGVPLELRGDFVVLLEKKWSQWKQEVSTDQRSEPKSSLPYGASTPAPSSWPSFLSAEISKSTWSWMDHLAPCHSDALRFTPSTVDTNSAQVFSISSQQDVGPSNSLATLPHLTSMFWELENRNTASANRVAFITLKLQDGTKSPVEETEVKFQLNKDTLETMIRSMTHINNKFSRTIRSSSEPMQKKQKQ